MPLITGLWIENFRSIRNSRIDELSDYEPILGLNSAGKSNLLRALKVFFHGTVDESDSPVSLARDYSDQGRTKGRYIAVGVRFKLDMPGVRYPRQATFVQNHGFVESLAIKQSWQVDSATNTIVRRLSYGQSFDDLEDAASQDIPTLDSFIRAINFRYVPNHAKPSDLMRGYLEPLREVLVSRLGRTREYQRDAGSDIFSALERTSSTLFESASKGISRGLPGVSVRPALPKEFSELAFDMALQSVDAGGYLRSPEFEGSGAQSFMLLHLLALADSATIGSSFGWSQGTIWAIEEPESYLHSGLRQRFAEDLHGYSLEARRQVIITTHQDEFVTVGKSGIVASKNAAQPTQVERMSSSKAVLESNRQGVTSYTHPLSTDHQKPLVIPEGKFDVMYLREAIGRSRKIRPRWRLVSPDSHFGEGTGGDALKQYLKYNKAAIEARPLYAPVLVLRDWEAKDVGGYASILFVHPHSTAQVMPSALVSAGLGTSFVGIERYLPEDYIQSMIPGDELLTAGNGIFEVKPAGLGRHKAALANNISSYEGELVALEELLSWIDKKVEEQLAAIPGEYFL